MGPLAPLGGTEVLHIIENEVLHIFDEVVLHNIENEVLHTFEGGCGGGLGGGRGWVGGPKILYGEILLSL